MSSILRQGLSISCPISYSFGCVGDPYNGACIFVGLRKWPLIFAGLKEARNAEMLLLPKGAREKSRTRGLVMKMGRQQLLRTLALSSLFNIVINHQTLFILCIFQHFQPCEIQNLKLFPNFVR